MRTPAIAVLALALGCSSKEPLTVQQYVVGAWTLLQTRVVCVGAVAPSVVAASSQPYLRFAAADPSIAEVEKSVAAGRARYDGAAARQCIDALTLDRNTCWGPSTPADSPLLRMKGRALDQLVFLEDMYGFARQNGGEGWLVGAPDACKEVVTGLLDDGASCYQSYECKSGDCIDPNWSCSPGADCSYARLSCGGVCRSVPREGEDCAFDPAGGDCALGLVCTGGKCQKPVAVTPSTTTDKGGGAGAPCTSGCSGHQLCLPASAGGALVCSVPQDIGGPCTRIGNGYGLASGCYDGSFCNATTGRCGPPPGVGEPCTCVSTPTRTGACRDGVSCDASTAFCDGHVCRALVPAGGSCDMFVNECVAGTSCNDNPVIGATCISSPPAPPFPVCVAPT